MRTWKAPVCDAAFVPMDADDWPEEIHDRWPPGTLRPQAMRAYDALARQGEILPIGVDRYASGVVIVRYRAKIPDVWIRELLGKQAQRA